MKNNLLLAHYASSNVTLNCHSNARILYFLLINLIIVSYILEQSHNYPD